MDIRTKELDLQLEILEGPNSDEEILLVTRSAKAILLSRIEANEYREGYHDQPIKTAQDETLQERYLGITDKYPYVEDFTIGEFLVFEISLNELLENKTKKKRGRPRKTEEDQAKQIQNDVQIITDKFQGLRHNLMTDQYEYLKIDDKSGKLGWYETQGEDLNQLSVTLACEHGCFIPAQRAKDAFIFVAKKNPFEPQRDMIDWCRQQHYEMTLEEAEQFLFSVGEELLGTHQDEPIICGQYLRNRFFARFLVAMAFLARNPGETLQWMPILVGAQGCGKSQFCTHLVPAKYKDLFQQMTLPIETIKREPFQLHIGFILEMPEIDAQMRNQRSIEPMKNLVTTRIDNCRRPYAAQSVKLLRRFGLIGTTNRSDLFQDGTGERRFMPILIPHGWEIPWEKVRDGMNIKLWAAADIIAETHTKNSREMRGFTDEERECLNQWQKNFTQVDPWETKLLDFIRLRREFTPSLALSQIGVEESRQTISDVKRLNNLMRQLFTMEQAKFAQLRRGGLKQWMWTVREMPGCVGDDEASEVSMQDLQAFAEQLKAQQRDF